MRRKVESKIRQAIAELGEPKRYRIDEVRKKAGIIRKVFDKTILDMARLNTIELMGGDTAGMDPSEIENLIHYGDELYVYFTLLGKEEKSKAEESEKIETVKIPHRESEKTEIVLKKVDLDIWRLFENLCRSKEQKDPVRKIKEMIHDYITNFD